MARIITEGFEGGDGTFWSSAGGASSTVNPRSGNRSWTESFASSSIKALASAVSEFYFRVAYKRDTLNANDPIIAFLSGASTTVIQINYTTDGSLSVLSNAGATTLFTTGPGVFAINNWYLLELYVKFGTGGVAVTTLKVDSIQRGTSTSANNQNGSSIDRFKTLSFNNANKAWYDDMGMNDTTGVVDNSWLGDGHIIALIPSATGTYSQWNPVGSVNHWGTVNDVPPDGDTSYVGQTGTGRRDSWAHTSSGGLLTGGYTISRVWVDTVGRVDVADGSSYAGFIRVNGTDFDGQQIANPTTYTRQKTAEWLVNPSTSGTWTFADLESVQLGVVT